MTEKVSRNKTTVIVKTGNNRKNSFGIFTALKESFLKALKLKYLH